jgi:radical SAM protein with 4Fe4S-binding SPASM domain
LVSKSGALLVKHFRTDHYTAIFNPRTGFFARVEDDGQPEPFWAEHGPELLDISVTNWCDRGCTFCYRKSDTNGSHMAIADFEEVLRQAAEMHVFQIALGGGNPNQHPQFAEMLQLARTKYGIVPNYTTNGRGLSEGVLRATARYCGAVAVSAYPPYQETDAAMGALTERGVTTNVHFILSSRSINTAIEWLNDPPSFLRKANAIVFLNYKPVGRYTDEAALLNRSDRLGEFFSLATSGDHPFRVGFDTCTITGLARLGKAHKISLEGCDAGRFSLFVSERMEAFPCSFMVEAGYSGVSLRSTTLADIWKHHLSFEAIRRKHQKGGCSDCKTQSECLSGCPLFPQMNLCPSNCQGRKAPAFTILA